MMKFFILFYFFTHNYVWCINDNNFQNDALSAISTSATGPSDPDDPNSKLIHLSPTDEQIAEKPQIENTIEIQEEQKPCYETELLMNVITILLNLIRQDPTYNGKMAMIFELFKKEVNTAQGYGGKGEIYEKLLKLENKIDGYQPLHFTDAKECPHTSTNLHITAKGNADTVIVFKHKIPHIEQPICKQVFLKSLQTAYENYMNLSKNSVCSRVVESYKNPQINMPPISLQYWEGFHKEDKLVNPDGSVYKNQIPKEFLNIYFPNGETDHVNSIHKNIYLNKLLPKDSKDILVIPGTNKPEKDNIQDSNSPISNTYILTQPDSKIPPEYDEMSGQQSKNILNLLYKNNNSQVDNTNSLNPYQNFWQIPTQNNITPEMSSNPVNYILQAALNIVKLKNQNAENNKPSKIINGDYDKVQGHQIDAFPQPNNWVLNNNEQKSGNINSIFSKLNTGTSLPKSIVELILKFPQHKQYILNNYYISTLKTPNSSNTNVDYGKLYTLLTTVANSNKLNTSDNTPGVVELTYVVKRPEPIIYQPLYYVKYRLTYENFVERVKKILKFKPYLKDHPVKLYNEIINISNVSDMSPDLKDIPRDKILQLTYNNGRLVNTQVLPHSNLPVGTKQLQTIHNLNTDVDAKEILNLNKDLTYDNYWKTYKVLSNNANRIVARPVISQKRYKIVNNAPPLGYNTYYPNQSYKVNDIRLPGNSNNKHHFMTKWKQ